LRALFTAIWALLVATAAALLMLVPILDVAGVIIADFVEFVAGRFYFAPIFALVVGLSLWLFALQFRGRNRGQAPSWAILQGEEGEVRLSMAAIDTLIQQAAGELRAVREVRTSFYPRNEGLGVYIRVVVAAEESIPELTAQLQKVVKEHVLRVAGISIEEVRVLVENVSTGPRSRVVLR